MTKQLTKIYIPSPVVVWISPIEWGGIVGTMFETFSVGEIDEKIIKLWRKLDKFNYVKDRAEIYDLLKMFTKEERDYINSPLLDTFYELESKFYSEKLAQFLESRDIPDDRYFCCACPRIWVPLRFWYTDHYEMVLSSYAMDLYENRQINITLRTTG